MSRKFTLNSLVYSLRSLGKITAYLFLCVILFTGSSQCAFGQANWDGNNPVGNFSYTDNWDGTPAWGSGNNLNFNNYKNNNQTSIYYDYEDWVYVQSIFYNSSFTPSVNPYPFNSNGKGINFYGKIENQSSVAQQMRIPLSFKGSDLELNPVKGDLILDNNNPLYNDPNKDINVWGFHHLILGNIPYGDASTKLVLQRNEVNNSDHYPYVEIQTDMKSNSNCFGGGVVIKAGELWFDAGGTLNGGTIQVGNTAYTAKVFLNDKDGGQTIDNNILVPAGATMSHIGGLNSSGTNTYSGNVTLNSSAFLEAWGGGTVNFSGDISGSNNVTIQRVYGTGSGTVQYSGISKTYTGATTISSDATLQISSNQTLHDISLNNGGTLIVDNGATLTITGAWTGGGTIINNGTIVLQGSAAFPGSATTITAMNNLTLNKAGTTSLDNNLTLTGSYNLLNGILNISSNNLTFDVSATTAGNTPGATNMIQADGIGKVIKHFSSTGTFTFPIGDNTSGADYSPATINMTSLSGTASVAMNVVDAKHPNNSSPSNYITRYWNVTSTGTLNANVTFTYTDGDVVGTETSLLTAGWNGTVWNLYGNVNSATNSLSIAGQSDLNRAFTAGDQFSPLASLSGDYFRSLQTGNWSTAGNWQSSPDGTNWITSTLVPDQNAKGITIRNGHTITLTADAFARKLKIEAGGTLDNTNTSGGYLLTIADDGTATSDFDIYGTYILYGTQPTFETNATGTVYSGGIVRADNNYSPGESDDFARNSQVSWNTGAIFNWNTTNAFETSGVTYFPKSGVNDIAIFRISKNVSVGAGSDTHFNGLLQVNANITFDVSGKKYFRNGICGNGTINQSSTCGNFIINGTNAILGGNNLKLNLTKVLNLNTSVTVPVDSSVTISGANVDNSLSGNTINVNGMLDMTSQNITNTNGKVIVSGTGTYRTSHSGGFTGTGSSIPSGTVTLNSGSTVEFYRTGDQPVISRGDYSNIILSGSGTKTPSSTFAPNGTITIKDDAIFDCTGKNVGGANTNLTMSDNSILIVSTTGTQPAMQGAYNITGGVIRFMHTGSGETIRSPKTYNNIEVWGSNVGNSSGNISLIPGGSFTVKNGGVFKINDNSISGNSSNIVEIESGGKFICGNNQGFNGFISALTDNSSIHANITNIILEPGSTVEYSRNGDQPITNANGLEYQNLTLSGTGNKIASSGTLIVKGDFSKTTASVFVHNNGTVEFNNSSSPQTYTSVAPYPVFYDVVNDNTSNLNIGTTTSGVNDSIYIAHSLTLGNSSRLNLDADIILQSNNDATAYIPSIPEGVNAASISYGNGRFVVERYIPLHSKAWQLLSVPTNGSTIQDSWQMPKGVSTSLWGTTITDSRSNWATNGFDAQSFSPSMKYYDPVNDTYAGVDKTTDLIDLHSGYFLFVRGDRKVAYGQPSNEVMLQTRGKIYEPQNLPPQINVLPGKWALVGNPYPSAIDFEKLSFSGDALGAGYYIWDPKLTTSEHSAFGLGGFRTIVPYGSGYAATPQDPNYADGEYPVIQSGQAFFVQSAEASVGNSFINFPEDAKVSGSVNLFRAKGDPFPSKIRANLYLVQNGERTLMDGTLQLFREDYSNKVDRYDAKKMVNSTENISLPSPVYPLIVEQRALPTEGDTLFYNLSNTAKRDYSIRIDMNNMPVKMLDIYFHDAFLKTSTLLHSGKNDFDFAIDSSSQSNAKDRFYITFKNVIPPFAFDNVHAATRENEIQVFWETLNQQSIATFTIEHSSDGNSFNPLSEIHTSALSSDKYQFTHVEPDAGIHYYRIKAVRKDRSLVYSEKVSTSITYGLPSVSLFPNPAREWIQLKLYRQPVGKYILRLTDTKGAVIQSTTIYQKQLSEIHKINLPILSSGFYLLEINKPDGRKNFEKIIIK